MKSVAEVIELCGGLESLREQTIQIWVPGDMTSPMIQITLDTSRRGAHGFPIVSVGDYRVVVDDVVGDPELNFEVDPEDWRSGNWFPHSFQQYQGAGEDVEHPTNPVDQPPNQGRFVIDAELMQRIRDKAAEWDQMIASRYLPLVRDRIAAGNPGNMVME